MFSISQFKENVKIVRPNLFYAEMAIPWSLVTFYTSEYSRGATFENYNTNLFKFRCEATELPGRTVATVDDQSYGPNRKFAYEITYNDINFQIIASQDMAERKIFEKWIDNIVTPTDLNNANFKGGLIKYYDDYAQGNLRIHQLNDQGVKLSTYTLYNAYPIQLSPMNLTWDETDTYQRFTVTMTYRYHTAEFF